jgi:lysophospholipase L1-like esterase
MRLLLVSLLVATAGLAAKVSAQLPTNARLAIIGDSITEQKLYSKFIETYLLACTGRSDIKVFQFGWSGERAGGFAARLENDLAVFKPTVATTCYGMNDGTYKPYAPEIGAEYEKNMRLVIDGLKKMGVQTVVVGSPGAVDPDFFKRLDPAVYNDTLAHLRDIAKKLAGEHQQPFANVFDTMMTAMTKAKPVLGNQYHVCGADGFHPAPNGHLLMAQAFLKGLGMDGNIGKITIDLGGTAAAEGAHKLVGGAKGSAEVESTAWPFCFDADPKAPTSTRSILPFTSFNQDLNRFTLVVKGLSKDKAKVTWGEESREFSKAQLEGGINLASEFSKTPFDGAFTELMKAVGTKQAHETVMIKNHISPMRKQPAEGDQAKAQDILTARKALKAELIAKQAELDAAARAKLKPVRHTIKVEEM